MSRLLSAVRAWFDSWSVEVDRDDPASQRLDWMRVAPFAAVHLACLAPFWVGWSPVTLGVAVGARMFFITGFDHRHFSHRTFRVSRPVQFALAVAGATAGQRGPLWWAAHHRLHHVHSDGPEDVRSPKQHGFFWSHVGWFTSRANFPTRLDVVPDLARFPELRFLDRFDTLVPALVASALFALGELLERTVPAVARASRLAAARE